MAERTRSDRVVVLRKTKLGETDLILTMLSSDGSQIRAVAKGARKPASVFSTRLELYAESDVLIAQGRSLDIVKEARLIAGHQAIRSSIERAAAAAPILELLWRVSQDGLPVPRLFDLTCAALDAIEEAPAEDAPRIAAASLLKILAFCGFRPSLARCVSCGRALELREGLDVAFSVLEGGAVCSDCRSHIQTFPVAASTIRLASALLGSTFQEIRGFEVDQAEAFSVLSLVRQWTREHAGCSLKSLDFLFTCGLF